MNIGNKNIIGSLLITHIQIVHIHFLQITLRSATSFLKKLFKNFVHKKETQCLIYLY